MKKAAPAPFRGASNNSSFFATGQPFAPSTALDNVIPFDPTKDRPRMGTRPGAIEYFPGTWGNGRRVQGSGTVARGRTQVGYALGTATDLLGTDGSGHPQAAIAGNVWLDDALWGLLAYDYENVTATGPYSDTGVNTQPNRSVNAIALGPPANVHEGLIAITKDSRIVIGESYNDGSANRVARITCRSASTLAVIWSKKMFTIGTDRFVSAITMNGDWVFVATNHFIRVFKLSDGSDPSTGNSSYGFNGWSTVAKDVKVSSDGNSLYGLFLGTSLGTVLASGCVVTAGVTAQHFRSGVMKFTIATAANLATVGQVLTQAILSPQIDGTNRYYEGTGTSRHNYCRFSEQMPWAPRGLSPTALILTTDGGFVVTHANAAWGPDANSLHTIANGYAADDYLPPDGSVGYWNVTKFDAAGRYHWRADADSIKTEDGGGGNFNDLLNPTALCICTDSTGNIFTGGRRTTPGFCVYGWDDTGNFLAERDLGSTIRCICTMPGSMNVVAGGDRNSAWPDSPGGTTSAEIWELNNADLSFRRSLDYGNVSGLGVVGLPGDLLAWVSDKV